MNSCVGIFASQVSKSRPGAPNGWCNIKRSETWETVRAGAEATKELAIAGGKAIDFGNKLISYCDGMLREFIGKHEDNMRFRRWENGIKVADKAAKLLRECGQDAPKREIPVKFALPLLSYATLEEDEGLREIWAQMLANAADASSRVELRTAYIDILKDLTAFDIKTYLSSQSSRSQTCCKSSRPPRWEVDLGAGRMGLNCHHGCCCGRGRRRTAACPWAGGCEV